MSELDSTDPYDFNIDGEIVVGKVTLNDDTAWRMFQAWIDGRCPVCGDSIHQHEVICDGCLQVFPPHDLTYYALKGIVEQLESCNYECEAGPLERNTAFLALRELATLA